MNFRRKYIKKRIGYDIINNPFKKKNKKYFGKSSQKSFCFYTNIIRIFTKIFLFILLICICYTFRFKQKKLKIAICSMAKHENLYIKEFIEYYEKLGINNIYLYDDNDNGTERIKDVVPKSKKIRVKVFENIKERIKMQSDAFTECYNNNKKKFDWFLMIDIDEYLVIKNNTIRGYLSSPIFNKCDFIKIHWTLPTDNNLVFYDNRTLIERFSGPYRECHHIKSIIRGNIDGLKYWIHSPYVSPYRNVTCNNVGEVQNYTDLNFQSIMKYNIDKAYIMHFQFKSTEEYVNKFRRGYSNWNWVRPKVKDWIFNYFKNNDITKEKIEYLEKEFNISLKKYRKIIKID